MTMVNRRQFVAAAAAVPLAALAAGAKVFADDWDYLRRKFREDVADPATGIGLQELKREVADLVARADASEPWPLVKARLFAHICDRMAIGLSEHDWFPAFACWSRRDRVLTDVINRRRDAVMRAKCPDAGVRARQVPWSSVRSDYDHAAPDWDAALRLGFTGLRDRNAASSARGPYHDALGIAAEAMLRTVKRLADHGRTCPDASRPRVREQVAALDRLCAGPPRTTYEAMLFMFLFFVFGEHVDHLQVRTLGNLDRLLGPYYSADLAAGRITEARFRDLLRHFWWQWGSIDNWWGQPVYIGGTKADGTTGYNDVSRIVLEVHDELALPTPKLQLKMADNTPDRVWRKALDMSRRMRSIVYCGERPMAQAMKAMGFSDEEARTPELWGCYEFQPRATANTTLPCILNVPHPVCTLLENARTGTFAAPAWEDFKAAYLRELVRRADVACGVVLDYERDMDDWIPSLVHSLSIETCVAKGGNAVGRGMTHNLTMILQCGLGTAVDALLATKEIVYERRSMSLAELGQVMKEDWKGHEALRLRMLRSPRKWGNGDAEAERLGGEILYAFGARVNGKPNSRGGKFVAGGHSIDFFYGFRGMSATPDGRRRGDELSKNLSPAPGADREGATALVNAFRAIDPKDIPGDMILDAMLVPHTVAGEKGLAAMRTLIETYFANGGCAINFNILDATTLRDAQAHPGKYANLQVRICGWNVRWNALDRKAQDAYILRAAEIAR